MKERVSSVLRPLAMAALLAGGAMLLKPASQGGSVAEIHFVDQAEQSGCLNRHTMVRVADVFQNVMPWLSSVGAAAAAGDYDADGDADLYVTNSGRGDRNVLFRNRGDGTFEDVTDSAGVGCGNPQGASMHAIWGDIDNDGDLDLYVTKWAETNQLFRNNHDGTFSDISQDAGVDYWGYGNGATFLDYDRDGHLDILIGNYFAETVIDPKSGQLVRNDLWNPVTARVMHETFTHADNGGRNVLYRNRGDGTFEDVAESVGLTFTGWTLSVGAGDLNNDGWPDLYLANDFGPDELYMNTGATQNPPGFQIVIDREGHPGVGGDWWKGMNVDMGDVNNDGYLDIYVTNIFEARYKTDEGNMLWLNRVDPLCPGGRGFRNIGQQTGTFDGGWGWAGKFADFNNDGLLDIYTVNGFVTGDLNRNYWYQVQEMVTQTKNQTVDATDWPEMGDRDLSGHERGRLFVQVPRHGTESADAKVESLPPTRGMPTPNVGMSKAGADANSFGKAQSWPRFMEMAEASGITDIYNGRGIAVADYNQDGYLDMYVANQGAPSCYYVNQTGARAVSRGEGSGGFLRLTLRGRPDAGLTIGDRMFASTSDAVGARITLESSDGIQVREVQGGMGFASQSEHTVHFGIPQPNGVTRLTIRWPSGRVQTFDGDAARRFINQHSNITEPVEEIAQR